MAEAFTPRFVDLVRNTTSTTGTGNFVLGPAVAGFTSFATAIQPGESFYYSCAGVDKADECEVGRGTLQADGTISREPIGGSLTSFTGGTKTVALVAAAEWFAKVDQANGGAGPVDVANRAALAAGNAQAGAARLLAEPGREGLFTFDSSDLATKVVADPRQAVYVTPQSDPTGASGAWVRAFDELKPEWFGAAGDGVTDDSAAFAAMRTLCLALRSGEPVGPRTAPPIRLSRRTYFLASSFDWKGCTNVWRGVGSGLNQFPTGSVIKMAAGAIGRRYRRHRETLCR